ncbi:MAG: creatininase family protein [Bacteroidota bacterium]
MYWDQLTTYQIDKLDRKIPVVMAVSATEQHGAHLPLATDRMIGEHLCKLLHEALPEKVLILPMIQVGCSEHHLDFTGSLSVKHETLLGQLKDIASSVVHHGFTNLILLNSHGGNQAIGQSFFEVFGYRNPEIKLVFTTWWKLAIEELKALNESGRGGAGHAGEFETSLMLQIAPHLVHLNQIKPKENQATFNWAEGDMIYGSQASYFRTMKQMTPGGVYGDPSFASKEKGEEISTIILGKLKAIVSDLYGS